MKKHKLLSVLAAVMVAASVLIFAVGCGGEEGSTDALLTSITIVGKAPDGIPPVMSSATWKNEDSRYEFFASTSNISYVTLDSTNDYLEAEVKVKVSAGAKAAFAPVSGAGSTASFNSDPIVDFTTSENTLVVRVTSESGDNVNYYLFRVQAKSAATNITSAFVAGIKLELGSAGSTYNGGNPGTLLLSNSKKDNAKIDVRPLNPDVTEIAYVVMTTAGAPAVTAYIPLTKETITDEDNISVTAFTTGSTGVNFADGQILYFRVKAEDGIKTDFYRTNVQVGRNASLQALIIGGEEAGTLGTPRVNKDFGAMLPANYGAYQADTRMPQTGFELEIVPMDDEAKISFIAGVARGATPAQIDTVNGLTDYTDPVIYQFPPDVSHMVIKVVSANTSVTNWYRIEIITKSWMPIYKGSPTFTDGSNDVDEAVWGIAEWQNIHRVNTAEGAPTAIMRDPETAHTLGRVRLLWDDVGLYAHWEISFRNYGENGVNVRKVSYPPGQETNPTPFVGVQASDLSNAHMRDTVELFVNERRQRYKSGNNGRQYRVSPNNLLSGDPADSYTTMLSLGKTRAWVIDQGADGVKDGGYAVMMQIPWGFKTSEDANMIFDADGKVKPGDDAEIGLEFQINACPVQGQRDGILTWNGIVSQAYQEVKSYGIGTLYLEPPTEVEP